MNVSTWAIKNPIPTVLLFILLTILGWMSFHGMKVQNFPDIELPTVSISALLPGAAPNQLETEVARKLENAIANIQGIKHIYTTVQDGFVLLTAEFRLEKETQEALDDVRAAIAAVRSDLPPELRDPVVTKLSFSGLPIVTYTVASAALDNEALSWFVDNNVTKALLAVPGVGKVSRVGGVSREVRIELDVDKMAALNLSALDVSRQLRATQIDGSGGRADIGGAEQSVRTLATVGSAAELAAMQIALPQQGGMGSTSPRYVRLDQVASVADTVAEVRSGAFLDGKPVVGFEVTRTKGASEVEVGQRIKAALKKLNEANPKVKIAEAFNFIDFVEESFEGSMILLLEGAILAVIVVFLFLRDWRATFVSATALPLSLIPAFIGMSYLGFSLNTVTLLSMSLVIGILVDDAIVEIENIMRHLRMGKTPMQAAIEAADEIGLAVVATTFTLIAVFLPTAFMSGIAGKFFKQFGWTAALAIGASLVVARMLTPLMAAYMLKPILTQEKEGSTMRWYMRAAAWCVHHRWITAFAAAGFFVGSLALVQFLPKGFVPPDDIAQTQIVLELPPGSTYADTLALANSARNLIVDHPHVKQIYTAVGGGTSSVDPMAAGGAAEARKASLSITLTRRQDRSVKKQVIESELRARLEALPGARISVGLGGSGEKYILVLSGEDGKTLLETARMVERELRTIPGLGNISSSASLIRPEVTIRPDFAKAAELGVSTIAIADTIRVATSGDYEQNLAKLNLSQRQVPIVVKLPASLRQDLDAIKRLKVPSATGSVALENVATVTMDSGPSQISRYDRLRNITFDIELNGVELGEVTKQVGELASIKALPPGVSQTSLGDAEVMEELFASFSLAMLTGIICIYVVLVLLFKGFAQPVTIMAALPLSIGGAFILLLAAGSSLSMPSMIGLIMLMGVATKNSILLVEYAIVARRDMGMNRFDAIMDACHKRARPIVMTTLAMGAGMLPIALGWGVDPSFRSPMAIAVIGGLITSTFLSLLVIPVVFTMVDDVVIWLGKVFGKKGQAVASAPSAAE